jgi:hypothetical protein
MRSVQAVIAVFACCFLGVLSPGCSEETPSRPPPVDADGKELTAPVRPGLKGKAAEQMKSKMPHL